MGIELQTIKSNHIILLNSNLVEDVTLCAQPHVRIDWSV